MISRHLLSTALLAALVAAPLAAQVGTASLTGVVSDATDSPIPGAALKIVNTESGVTREFTIDAQ